MNKSEIMERLMIKTVPQELQYVSIDIPKSQELIVVTLETPIVDKRADDFSRIDFMSQLSKPHIVTYVPTKNPEQGALSNISEDGKTNENIYEEQTEEQVEEQTEEQTEGDVGMLTTPASDDSPARLIILRKLNSKIKLVQQERKSSQIKSKRISKKPTTTIIQQAPEGSDEIEGVKLATRIGNKSKIGSTAVKADAYYLANREKFINFVTKTYSGYKKELEKTGSVSCERDENADFSPMAHQNIVKDYMSRYSPYRGILLFHGLGSGKTCSSIAIAEGLKTDKQVIVMTPASLRMNYIEELKKCGDLIYKKNQFWKFISTDTETATDSEMIVEQLSGILGLPTEFIRERKGAWLVNVSEPTNYETLNIKQQKELDEQINVMIANKYSFINYNGIRKAALSTLSKNGKINPFDNKVIIIDEAHNFVSRIVNKLGREDTLSGALYNYIMSAENARVVLLTGTPIINYPNEIAILFNMLRGFIKTWSFKLSIEQRGKITQKYFDDLFNNKTKSGAVMDYIEYNPTSTTLRVTRNPFGFVNTSKNQKHSGVKREGRGEIDDKTFEDNIVSRLKGEKIIVSKNGINVKFNKCLPDSKKEFQTYFIDDKTKITKAKNMALFKRRILGLSSYFRDVDSLMPQYNKDGGDFTVVKVEMSDYQLGVYEKARKSERKMEKDNAKKKKSQGKKEGIFDETVSTYRIFSRSFCNFVFPKEIIRPLPGNDEEFADLDEDDLDGLSIEEKTSKSEGRYDNDDAEENTDDKRMKMQMYKTKITETLRKLSESKYDFLNKEALQTYSPKFLNILENVDDKDHRGSHLIYSQFRTLEGIGILKLVFEANGFAEFKITKKGGVWDIDIPEKDMQKPKFVLYTGSETAEEKEHIRNIFNGAWKYVPSTIVTKLKDMQPDNLYGDLIKVLMITASGAEGISLKNVRYVHITEPYWHPVRTQQVIGRARRICSHQDLPKVEQTVKVFLYLMMLTDEQRKSDKILELRKNDQSKLIPNTPYTSDETLYEIATMKEDITNEILQAVKESSFDCTLHAKRGSAAQVKCFTFGSNDPAKFSYAPSYEEQETDAVAKQNQKEVLVKSKVMKLGPKEYAVDQENNVYDLDDYNNSILTLIGNLKITGVDKDKVYKLIPA